MLIRWFEKWLDWPPVWLVIAMAAMWALAQIAPFPDVGSAAMTWAGRGLIVLAIAIMVWAALWFQRQQTTLVPHRQPDALVTGGPYRWSRNPIYAADALILIGWGLSLGALLPFIVLPVFVKIIDKRFILPEEGRLRAHFGADFDAFCARVRRWV